MIGVLIREAAKCPLEAAKVMREMVRLCIDFENPSPEWWQSGGRELWESVVEGFDNNDALLDRALAESWLEQAGRLPGWDGGPEIKQNGLVVLMIGSGAWFFFDK